MYIYFSGVFMYMTNVTKFVCDIIDDIRNIYVPLMS